MKRLVVVMCAAILVFTACSSGGGGGKKAGTKEAKQALQAAGGDFCKLGRNIQELNDQSGDEDDDTFTPEEIADFRAIVAAFVDAAPDEIKADAELLGQAAEAFLQYLEITGGEFVPDESKLTDEQKQQIEELQKKFSEADTTAASNRVNSFTEKKCDIDMDGDGDTDGDPNTSGTPPQDTGTTEPTG